MAVELIGRGEELGSVQAFLEQVQVGPAALVLSGEPGIGKTVLWEAGVEEAKQRFGRVLSHRSAEAEAELAFAGLTELVTPVLPEVAAFLPPLRRKALEVALLLVEPGEQAPDARAIGLALLDVLQLLAQQGPVVVAVDDLQWLDTSSLAVLEMALRRLRHERVGFLPTVRETAGVALPIDLGRSLSGHELTRLSLGPLSLAELRRLLKGRLALELARPELVRLHETSGGNPFFALELGRELARQWVRPEPGKPLPVPSSLETLLGGRLARLPAETRRVLLIAAAAASPTLDVIGAAHKDEKGVQEALELAVREGVIELDDSRIRFSHPLLASICYEQAPLWDRRAVHRALAGAVTDVEERARHLALAAEGPDAVVASDLEVAAEQAAARGATTAAAELYELAVGLTPTENVDDSRRRRLRAAECHLLAGAGLQARALLEQLLEEAPPGVERADVLEQLALSEIQTDYPAATRLLEEAVVEAAGDDSRGAEILGWLSTLRLSRTDVTGAVSAARAALEKAERVGDPALLARALAHVAWVEMIALQVTPGLLERGVAIEEELQTVLDFWDSPGGMLGVRLTYWDDPERARPLLERAEATAVERGVEPDRAFALAFLAQLEAYAGRWPQALEHAVALLELAEQIESDQFRCQGLYLKALVEAHLGQVDQARREAEEALAISHAVVMELLTIMTLGLLGSLELALGNLETADRYLRELPERLLSLGWNDPSHLLWPDTIETLAALGQLEQAHAYLEQYEAHAERSSRFNRAGAARCRGLLAAAEGDLDAAFASFDRALAELEALPYPFERARTLLALGSVHRKAKQKRLAREALEQALTIFEELGARQWAEKTRAELRRISGRRPASAELTETEERVARLAAEGRSNKEIAAALFMSVHTVEAHLTRVYRKLGIHSRGQLAARLVKPTDVPAKALETAAKQ